MRVRSLALFVTLFICAHHVSLRSKVTPRYVGFGSAGRVQSLIFSVAFCDLIAFVKMEYVVLAAFMVRNHCFDQLPIWSSDVCMSFLATAIDLCLTHSAKSSAYIALRTSMGMHGAMSLTKTRKRVGDSTPPCGTPCSRVRFLLSLPST